MRTKSVSGPVSRHFKNPNLLIFLFIRTFNKSEPFLIFDLNTRFYE